MILAGVSQSTDHVTAQTDKTIINQGKLLGPTTKRQKRRSKVKQQYSKDENLGSVGNNAGTFGSTAQGPGQGEGPKEQKKQSKDPMLRSVCYTYNNYTQEGIDKLKNYDNTSFHVSAYELGTTGTIHIQGYMELKTRTRFSKLQRDLAECKGIHLEARRGSAQQAIDYITNNEGKIREYGPPKICILTGQPKEKTKATDVYEARQYLEEGLTVRDLVDDPSYEVTPGLLRVYKELAPVYERKRDWKPEVIWIYGRPRTGKSSYARTLAGNSYYNFQLGRQWFDGYDGEETVLWDDFDNDYPYGEQLERKVGGEIIQDFTLLWKQKLIRNMLLQLTDRHDFRAPIKGSSKQCIAKKVIIVSHVPPWHIWTPTGHNTGFESRPHESHINTNDELVEVMGRLDDCIYVKGDPMTFVKYPTVKTIDQSEIATMCQVPPVPNTLDTNNLIEEIEEYDGEI